MHCNRGDRPYFIIFCVLQYIVWRHCSHSSSQPPFPFWSHHVHLMRQWYMCVTQLKLSKPRQLAPWSLRFATKQEMLAKQIHQRQHLHTPCNTVWFIRWKNSNVMGLYSVSKISEERGDGEPRRIHFFCLRPLFSVPTGSIPLPHQNEEKKPATNIPHTKIIVKCGEYYNWGTRCTSDKTAAAAPGALHRIRTQ